MVLLRKNTNKALLGGRYKNSDPKSYIYFRKRNLTRNTMPIPLMALAAAPAIAQGLTGLYQTIKGAGMKVKRPKYKTPQGIAENQALAAARANSEMAGTSQAYDEIERSQQSSMRTMREAGGSSGNLLAAAAAGAGGSQRAKLGIAQASEEYKSANIEKLNRANQVEASYRDKEWDWNKRQKYEADAATKSALLGSGMQNIMGGISSASSAAVSSMYMGEDGNPASYFDSMMQQSKIARAKRKAARV
jgi:hypothetical protein